MARDSIKPSRPEMPAPSSAHRVTPIEVRDLCGDPSNGDARRQTDEGLILGDALDEVRGDLRQRAESGPNGMLSVHAASRSCWAFEIRDGGQLVGGLQREGIGVVLGGGNRPRPAVEVVAEETVGAVCSVAGAGSLDAVASGDVEARQGQAASDASSKKLATGQPIR